VRDALLALGLAAARRRRRRLPDTTFVGVTGSAVKTTTKDLIAAVLGTQWSGTKTPGSENRLATLGRTILRSRGHDGFCVAEIPTWVPSSVAGFTLLVRPDVGVVTRVGTDH
jgi:UDP-N-acetylmuramoyl-tripeptide--D-alanyl-D-alanine ligase